MIKLAIGLVLFGASLVSAAVLPHIDVRAELPSPECVNAIKQIGLYHEAYDASCTQLVYDCLAQVNGTEGETADLWSVTSCTTAATCQGTYWTVFLAQCWNSDVDDASDLPHLNYNIYANIVGDCAWQEGGCSSTFQNYVDWFYGALSAVDATIWPDFSTVEANWDYIVGWTLTGDTIPYTNFDDWLHYSYTT
ncbi:uncharacterized protein BT62DRAFT_936247 [Guyanagaster necrorhizus]|uniref:Uncharacterized protein n=1 Tax=Guyanagaster necrorhizus TaxID=856835 RepID=A0A9P7VKR6_9AGAR|nr:uncharacterized protein BT62DRAFT_936247 [Guyanagaster necrorhizus MCA 3950]KAG7442155.1 hypothetical protein BT62DRAFT_936247 [Guyanagaster necrorhizus MCA 3950]